MCGEISPVEILRATHGNEAVGIGQLGEDANLIAILELHSKLYKVHPNVALAVHDT